MVVQDVPTQTGNVVESESAVKEAFDGRFVGGIENRAGCTAATSDFDSLVVEARASNQHLYRFTP